MRPIPQVVHPAEPHSLFKFSFFFLKLQLQSWRTDRCDCAPSPVSLVGLRGRKVMQNQRPNRYKRPVSHTHEHAHRRKKKKTGKTPFSAQVWEGNADETFVQPDFSGKRHASFLSLLLQPLYSPQLKNHTPEGRVPQSHRHACGQVN